MPDHKTMVRNLYCSRCSNRYELDEVIKLCDCGAPLLVDYDYGKASDILSKEMLKSRISSMWRYRELLPVKKEENIISLGEGYTPLLESSFIGTSLGMKHLYLKDETNNPTGSFKARGLCMAVSKAKELGLKKLIIPTAGNAGSALAAYSARAGIESYIIMPADTPNPFQLDCSIYGAGLELIDGTIKDCGKIASEKVEKEGWFPVSTLKEPYRIEGKKTMGYEIAEYFKFDLPDVIIYPTGGGTGLIGMWKAFDEMERMGWIEKHKPKMISVQSEGCAPIVRAFENGKEDAEEWEDPATKALGLRVPSAIGDFLILKAIRESGGTAVSVSEDEILKCTYELGEKEGIFSSPEGGASLAALKKLLHDGLIKSDERIVIFITGNGSKYSDVFE
jgi:threonine synthase